MYKVELTYFHPSGKYYSSGEYATKKGHMFEIFDEVRRMRDSGSLPGLVAGYNPFIVLVKVPKHPHEYPRLII